jgi:ABC-type bacteriocin/lantibiotic exporter with double-glycine peptidase domain
MIKHVRQEDANGCGIACAAMVAGTTYQEALDHVLNNDSLKGCQNYGMQHIELSKLLRIMKVRFKRHMLPKFPTVGPYILCVPSLNVQAAGHYVVADILQGFFAINDPQKGNEGKRHYKSHVDDEDKEGIRIISYHQVIEVWNWGVK